MARSIAAGDPYDPAMPTLIDGGMGSELEARGAAMDHEAWCGLANLEAPDLVREIHVDYIRAGADVIIANTFPTNRPALAAAGYGDRFEEANRAAVAAAMEARAIAARPVTVAGSMSLWGPHEELPAAEAPSEEHVLEVYGEQAAVLADAGVDVIVLEMFDARWAAARRAARATGLPVWLGVWGRLGDDGNLETPTRRPLEEDLPELIGDGADAVLVMHAPLETVVPALAAIAKVWDGPRGAYPHAGHFERPNWVFKDVAPSVLADEAEGWVRDGATFVGGCCGTRPEHIRALRERFPAAQPAGEG
jgi:homocysteine S-methyltransferase